MGLVAGLGHHGSGRRLVGAPHSGARGHEVTLAERPGGRRPAGRLRQKAPARLAISGRLRFDTTPSATLRIDPVVDLSPWAMARNIIMAATGRLSRRDVARMPQVMQS
jgi:hypothetical protein